MIERAIAILQQAGFDFTGRELAEIIWLAVHIEEPEELKERSPQLPVSTPTVSELEPPRTEQTQNQTISEVRSLPQVPQPLADVYLPSSVPKPAKTTETQEVIPIKVPAAIALRNTLALARALRPLMRKVPSVIENILDEEATVDRIAEQKIWVPVLKGSPQKWLELALVVEQSSSTTLWKQTMTELQRLLKYHGAFRDVRTWELQCTETKVQLFSQNSTGAYNSNPYSPEILIDPKGQRLILLVSDCISPAWRKKLIYPVLELWGRNGLITILQLLPEKLWERTALASEIPVQLHASKPGVPNSKLIEKTSDENIFDEIENTVQEDGKKIQNSILVPVITLEPEPLLIWSRVIVGQGNLGTPGFKLSFVHGVEPTETQQATEQNQPHLTAPALVSRFRATASPMARRLAGLMAAAPISLPVVQLIQQTLLPQSAQVHVAEVFMSGLLKPIPQSSNPDYIEYEFIEGIRELLLDSVPVSKTNLVLEKVSEFISQRVGLSIQEFEARLLTYKNDSLETKIRPFAQLKAQVLHRLGGDYARFAEQLEATNKEEPQDFIPFQIFPFEVATINFEYEPTINLQPFEFEVATIELKTGFLGLRRPELILKHSRQQAQYFIQELGNGVQLEMVQIPGGSFVMGAPREEKDSHASERPQHQVTISPFYLSKYPVTQAQWKAVASLPQINRELNPNPSRFKGANRPVEQVSWYSAVEFCVRLSRFAENRVTRFLTEHRLASHTTREYRLPSEAEWEYACRAGTTTPFHFGETMTSELANYNAEYTYGAGNKGIYRKQTTEVGSFGVANAFGLYDMHGNVWEWCLDDWYDNYEGAPADGSPWLDNNNFSQKKGRTVLRGGSCFLNPWYCRSASRTFYGVPDGIDYDVGFRVCWGVGKISW